MRAALGLVMLVALAGCERRVTAFSLRDAGAPADASADAAFPRGDSRFADAGSRADFEAALRAFSGRFAGVIERDPPARFDIVLTPEGGGHGRFAVQCDEPGCDPFGIGSSLVESGTFSLVQVNGRGEAEGELAWQSNLAPVQTEFWQLEVEGDTLRFLVGQAGLARDRGVYARILLTRVERTP
jgi:hypothetical protein